MPVSTPGFYSHVIRPGLIKVLRIDLDDRIAWIERMEKEEQMRPTPLKPLHVNLKSGAVYRSDDPRLQTFTSGATRTPSRLRYDLVPPTGNRAVAERFGIGGIIHGPVNWLKGIPFSAMIYHMQEHIERFKSGARHIRTIIPQDGSDSFEYTDGDVENLAAIAWGAMALIHYISEGRDDLDDRVYATPRQP